MAVNPFSADFSADFGGGASLTATLAETQAPQTIVAGAGPGGTAALAATQAAQTISARATGAPTTDPWSAAFSSAFGSAGAGGGALAATQAAQTISASATLAAGTTLTSTQATQTVSAGGIVSLGGGLSTFQAAQTVSGAAIAGGFGRLSATQAAQTLAAAGNVPRAAGLSATQAAQTISAGGIAAQPKLTAAVSATQASQALAAAAAASTSFHVAGLTATQTSQTLVSIPAVSAPVVPVAAPTVIVGSQSDFVGRLKAVLPIGWFPDTTPVLDGLLNGIANTWASLWSLLSYVIEQKRIATATDINLDIISADFLGPTLPRKAGESDASFRARIQASIFQKMATRSAVSNALTALNGAAPTIFEPANANDTGGWGAKGAAVNTGLGYGAVGGYGSYQLGFQAFIQTNVPDTTSSLAVQGYGTAGMTANNSVVIGGYGVGSIEFSTGSGTSLVSADEEVYDVINGVKPIASIMWVSTTNSSPQGASTPLLDSTFILDVSRLG